MPKETYIPQLFQLFQQYGYDGATLSKIAAATGLGKASLYHHFPGGKDDMVQSVLTYAEAWLTENVLQPLARPGNAQERLRQMCDRINELYSGGTQPCLLAILQAGTGRELFHSQVKALIERWIAAIATVLTEAGLDEAMARQRSEESLVAIQGGLMLSQALDNVVPFQRVLQALPEKACRPALVSQQKIA
ncbi:MAG: TetR/AcrR family transcriptional regulator [Leptolyngbyaceae cyanobacterium]